MAACPGVSEKRYCPANPDKRTGKPIPVWICPDYPERRHVRSPPDANEANVTTKLTPWGLPAVAGPPLCRLVRRCTEVTRGCRRLHAAGAQRSLVLRINPVRVLPATAWFAHAGSEYNLCHEAQRNHRDRVRRRLRHGRRRRAVGRSARARWDLADAVGVPVPDGWNRGRTFYLDTEPTRRPRLGACKHGTSGGWNRLRGHHRRRIHALRQACAALTAGRSKIQTGVNLLELQNGCLSGRVREAVLSGQSGQTNWKTNPRSGSVRTVRSEDMSGLHRTPMRQMSQQN